MPKIKLKEWAERRNLSYITANRHFHAGLIPNAEQLDSGTILVEDDSLEQNMTASTNDAMSLFLKKTVEFSKNNSSVEDFAAYVISNFQLKLNSTIESPKYSKNKPKPEAVQEHFKQFLPDKDKSEQLKAIKNVLKEQVKAGSSSDAADLEKRFNEEPNPFTRVVDTVNTDWMAGEFDDIGDILSSDAPQDSGVHMYDSEKTAEGLVTRSVDLNTTPQQINYTGSTNQTFSSSLPAATTNCVMNPLPGAGPWASGFYVNSMAAPAAAAPFQPTQKELLSAVQVIETAENEDLPRKRGRKPTFKRK